MLRAFRIENGKEVFFILRKTMDDAKNYAINISDHSQTIEVKEIEIDLYGQNTFIIAGRNLPDEQFKATNQILIESVNLIGLGQITLKDNGSIDYQELLSVKNDHLLVVHSHISNTHSYNYGLSYEIKIVSAQQEISQIGGGFGASGFMTRKYCEKVFHYGDHYWNHKNRYLISKVCSQIRTQYNLAINS